MSENRPPSSGDTSPESRPPGGDEQSRDTSRTPNTLFNALIGAVVTVVTAFFIPLSPVLGGAVAGYLEGSDAESGLKIGALSGAFAMVPLVVIVPFVLFVFVFDPIVAVSVFFVVALAVGFLLLYTVGLGALGGVLGIYLYEEFGD